MASFGFKFEGNDVQKDKFGSNKKQDVGKSYSYNPVSAGQDEGLSRNKPFLSFSSSVTD